MATDLQSIRIWEGSSTHSGATWDGLGVNFCLFSANATKVELCLFDQTGTQEIHRIELPEYTDEIWHGYLPDAGPGTVYAYRVYGPYEPEKGHRFNPNKLVLDPCAKAHIGQLKWGPELFGYTLGAQGDDLTFDKRDSAPLMPKCVVVDPAFTWANDRRLIVWPRDHRPNVPWDRTIIYEIHVKGFTKRNPNVPENLRGTFAGLARKEVIDYIRSLGVTSVELLPIYSFVREGGLLEKGLTNYWGYNPIGFFAADPRYFATGAITEFKQMVAHFHDAGLEVILDVVYNHTAEGNERGPTLSFRGIDNASYYRLLPDKPKMHCFGMLIDGRAQTSGIKRRASDVTMLIVINSYYDRVKFTLPEFVGGDQWMMFIDTNDPERKEASTLKTGDKYDVTGRSLLLLAALTSGEPVKVISRLALDELLREDVRPHEGHRAGEFHQNSNIGTRIQ